VRKWEEGGDKQAGIRGVNGGNQEVRGEGVEGC
jgi:hypothetical protein